jgi:anti-anti-sigma factor
MYTPIHVVQQCLPEGTCRIGVFGEVDVTTVDQVTDALTDAIEGRRAPVVILDLQEVAFMGACGFTAIIDAHTSAGKQEIAFGVENATSVVARLLDHFGVGHIVQNVRSVASHSCL